MRFELKLNVMFQVGFLSKDKDPNIVMAACMALGEISRKASLPIPNGAEQVDDDHVMDSDNQSGSKAVGQVFIVVSNLPEYCNGLFF